jgi:single-strand DNA-binding protein
VTIIGTVGADPEIKHFQSGTCVTNVRIAVNAGGRKSDSTQGGVVVVEEEKTNWFPVDVWGEEGIRMAEHVRKGRTICVQGQLKTESWTDKDTGAPRSRVKIVAKQFSFVASSKQGGGGEYDNSYTSPPPRQQQRQNTGASQQQARAAAPRQMGMASGTSPKEALWRSLAEKPETWYDNRDKKAQPGANPKSPDFKHKESGDALWIDSRDTPAWVLETLSGGGGAPAAQQSRQPAGDGYYGASNPGAYEPDYSQPYGQQAQYGGYQPMKEGVGRYTPAAEYNPDDPPF